MALFQDSVISPLGAPVVDVVTTAKIDLKAGSTLDGLGFYMTYGMCENADVVARDRLLPMGIAEGCRLKRDIPKDQVLTYDDVELPTDSPGGEAAPGARCLLCIKAPGYGVSHLEWGKCLIRWQFPHGTLNTW